MPRRREPHQDLRRAPQVLRGHRCHGLRTPRCELPAVSQGLQVRGRRDATPLWNVNAGLACMDCHDHDEQYGDLPGVHPRRGSLPRAISRPPRAPRATAVTSSSASTPSTRSSTLHGSAYRMCARCHPEEYESYDDYYHGAAYKNGATDAPACWDCHGAHEVLPTSDPESLMSEQNRADTCGQEGCHARLRPGEQPGLCRGGE